MELIRRQGGLEAKEYLSILRVLPIALNGLLDSEYDEFSPRSIGRRLSNSLLLFINFYERFFSSRQDDATLADMQRSAMDFRIAWTSDLGAYSPSEWCFPKFHAVTHCCEQIAQWGAEPVCEVDGFER